MEHIAIDLGGRKSQICVRSSDGAIVVEQRRSTSELGLWLAQRPSGRVILETCAEAFAVADAALQIGHEVRVVPATLVRSLGVGARGQKTDRRDAQVLSEVSCRIDLPSVHIPKLESRERKSMCGMRDALVRSRPLLINTVRGWLRGQAQRPRSGEAPTFVLRVRAMAAPRPPFIERQLDAIAALNEQIRAADREVRQRVKADPLCRRLMTVPGVGPVTALRFVSAIDEIGRFANAHQVESYVGLVPGQSSSSDRERRTGITKAGATALRTALIQSAWAARRSKRIDPLQQWASGVEARRGKFVAACALARKLAGILFALWRDGSIYEPSASARLT